MSAEQNIQIVQDAYAAFGRGDIGSILEVLDENVAWVAPEIGHGPGGTYHGKAGAAEFFRQVGETWTFQAFEPKDFIASGDQVAVTGSYAFTSTSTGRSAACDWVMVWKIQNGKVVRFQEYVDTAILKATLEQTAVAA